MGEFETVEHPSSLSDIVSFVIGGDTKRSGAMPRTRVFC